MFFLWLLPDFAVLGSLSLCLQAYYLVEHRSQTVLIIFIAFAVMVSTGLFVLGKHRIERKLSIISSLLVPIIQERLRLRSVSGSWERGG